MKPMVVVIATLVVAISVTAVLYNTYEFAQHTPGLCRSCHLMRGAYDTWSHSEHKDIHCHSCHKATIAEQNRYLVNMLIKRPKEVPARHGRVIVPRTICLDCHWEGKPEITKVNASAGHSLHAFTNNIECTKCHAQQVHRFLPDSKVCAGCHQKVVKAAGMEQHDCQLCHSWKASPASSKSTGLLPNRESCLACHGATKPAGFPASAPHQQFECSRCHQPHTQPLPRERDCLQCHGAVRHVGRHAVHLDSGLSCKDCHKPHSWTVTDAQAKVDCARCHDYRAPATFIAAASLSSPLAVHEVETGLARGSKVASR